MSLIGASSSAVVNAVKRALVVVDWANIALADNWKYDPTKSIAAEEETSAVYLKNDFIAFQLNSTPKNRATRKEISGTFWNTSLLSHDVNLYKYLILNKKSRKSGFMFWILARSLRSNQELWSLWWWSLWSDHKKPCMIYLWLNQAINSMIKNVRKNTPIWAIKFLVWQAFEDLKTNRLVARCRLGICVYS